MTEEVQDQELHDEVTDEVVEEAHDPKNVEAQSVQQIRQVRQLEAHQSVKVTKPNKIQCLKTKAALMAAAVW